MEIQAFQDLKYDWIDPLRNLVNEINSKTSWTTPSHFRIFTTLASSYIIIRKLIINPFFIVGGIKKSLLNNSPQRNDG